jgi:hypothetical protein
MPNHRTRQLVKQLLTGRRAVLPLLLAVAPLVSAAPTGIANIDPLAFGMFAAGSGGSVLVSPAGMRSPAGGVVLLSPGSGSAARFDVSGDANQVYAIALPANGSVSLSRDGANVMPLTDFTSSPAGSGLLNPLGRQRISVGARLNVSSQQPSGNYQGSFVIHVDYN